MFKSSFFTALAFGISVIALVLSVYVAVQTKSVPRTVVSRIYEKPAVSMTPSATVSAAPSMSVSVSPTVKSALPLRTTAPVVSVSPTVR